MIKFDKEEKEILEAFDANRMKRSKAAQSEISRHKTYAEATFKKDARINIRLLSKDLRALQVRALQEGIPYQTLVASVLHKNIDGQLKRKWHLRSDNNSGSSVQHGAIAALLQYSFAFLLASIQRQASMPVAIPDQMWPSIAWHTAASEPPCSLPAVLWLTLATMLVIFFSAVWYFYSKRNHYQTNA